MTDYRPVVGDRVRVTQVHEGEVTNVNEIGFCLSSPDGRGIRRSYYYDPEGRTLTDQTIEKLQDPEPRWVNGDVIEVVFERTIPGSPFGPRVVARIGGGWVFTDTGDSAGRHLIGNHWPNVKILHKADSPGVTAIACTPNQDR